jgi:cobyrinic acid a,c-diamide synthase
VLAESLRAAAADGMPVYAECGGLMYLAKELVADGVAHPMAGVIDLVVEQTSRPEGHGYTEGTVERANPFFETGARLRGHEFHYSRPQGGASRATTVVGLGRGTGIGDGRDAIVEGRVWASYLHLHALGTPAWAPGLVGLARAYRRERPGISAACG